MHGERMPYALFVYPTTRHNAVNVRMVEQVRSPRMENGSHTSKQSLCSSEGVDGAPCCLEHTVVEDTLMSHRDRMQTRRQREYDMEILSRDDFFPAEELTADILSELNYTYVCTNSIGVGGHEIDVKAKYVQNVLGKEASIPVICECKAHDKLETAKMTRKLLCLQTLTIE